MAIFGYVRVSTVTQAREGESLEAQRRQVTSYAASRGLELPPENVFVEAGVSGSIEFQDRPEGAKLFTQMVSGDMVIFPKLDRAFRNTRNALNVLHELKGRGISVHFIDLGGDVTGNGVGAIVFTILSAFATFEKLLCRHYTSAGARYRRILTRFTGIVINHEIHKIADSQIIHEIALRVRCADKINRTRQSGGVFPESVGELSKFPGEVPPLCDTIRIRLRMRREYWGVGDGHLHK
jgi:hypothetical protein